MSCFGSCFGWRCFCVSRPERSRTWRWVIGGMSADLHSGGSACAVVMVWRTGCCLEGIGTAEHLGLVMGSVQLEWIGLASGESFRSTFPSKRPRVPSNLSGNIPFRSVRGSAVLLPSGRCRSHFPFLQLQSSVVDCTLIRNVDHFHTKHPLEPPG